MIHVGYVVKEKNLIAFVVKHVRNEIHARYARVKRVRESMYGTLEGNICIFKMQKPDEREDLTNNNLKDLERLGHFCYLGDTINGDESSELAVTRRVRSDWNAFNNLSSML